MKKLQMTQMEGLQGGKCWDVNIIFFEVELLVHNCKAKDRWHWWWE